ncbi:GAF and ANTAR domain-containing protein [Kocuria turfanensis]|uniref:Transcriptional regulator n=1 Tax=Kocuria turfanensis TaxID=388357 RepID=A0A512IIK1_9MICC|nr:GAF and ANTAR domain-containing protein [Kocuria turfanensis]GEO97545.1 transcriptional regulator [Kocuria turfanensis]
MTRDADPLVEDLVVLFTGLHEVLVGQAAAPSAVTQIAQLAVHLIGPAAGAGVSLLEPGGAQITAAATDAVVEAVDGVEDELGEGPCLSAWASAVPERVEDTGTETRWPGWSTAVTGMGVGAVLAVPLVAGGQTLGVIKVYATTPHAFSATDERSLELLAAALAALLTGGQASQDPPRVSTALRAVLTRRQTVDTATGVLMERHHLDRTQAMARLQEAAEHEHQSVPEAARRLLDPPEGPVR